jgi:hypothetical protein
MLLLRAVGNRHVAVVKARLGTGKVDVNQRYEQPDATVERSEEWDKAIAKPLLNAGRVAVVHMLLSHAVHNRPEAIANGLLDTGKVDWESC